VATKSKKPKQRRKKYTDLDREKALAIYATTGNLSKTSRETGVPISTLRGWIAAKPSEEIVQARLDAKKRFIEEAWQSILKGIKVGNRKLDDLMLSDTKNIRLTDISTYIGTLYDKIALATNQPTAINKQEGQVTQRYEYDIIQKIVTDPDAREQARSLFRRAVGFDLGGGCQE